MSTIVANQSTWWKWLKIGWTILLTVSLLTGVIWLHEYNLNFFKNFNLLILLKNGVLTLFAFTSFKLLIKLNLNFGKGWLSWVLKKDSAFANINFFPMQIKYFGILFTLLFIFNLPVIVTLEEIIFRQGTTNLLSGIFRSILFGMVHCVVGTPFGVGIVLSFVGLWFTKQYFIGGIALSSQHHFYYNLVPLTLILFSLIIKHTKKASK